MMEAIIPFVIGTIMWLIFCSDEKPRRFDLLGWHLAGANIGWYLVDIIKVL